MSVGQPGPGTRHAPLHPGASRGNQSFLAESSVPLIKTYELSELLKLFQASILSEKKTGKNTARGLQVLK